MIALGVEHVATGALRSQHGHRLTAQASNEMATITTRSFVREPAGRRRETYVSHTRRADPLTSTATPWVA